MNIFSRPRDFLLKLGMKAWFVGLTALAGALAGLWGAIYTEAIKASFPFALACCSINYEAWAFWVLFTLFGFGFATTFWAQNKLSGAALDALQKLSSDALDQTKSLESIIRTLPPDGFLDKFQDMFYVAHAVVRGCQKNSLSDTELEDATKLLLLSIARLAIFFDGNPKGIRYSANVMLYRTLGSMNEQERTEARQRMLFLSLESQLIRWMACSIFCPQRASKSSATRSTSPRWNRFACLFQWRT